MLRNKVLSLLVFTILVIGYNNCAQEQFSQSQGTVGAAGAGSPICGLNGNDGPPGLVATGISYIPLVPDTTSGCKDNCFDVLYTLNQGNQALALSQYNGPTGLESDSPQDVIQNTVEQFFNPSNPYVNVLNNPLYLSAINFPDIYFSNGFSPQGEGPLQANGQVLDQYFAFRAQSVFTPIWAPGKYQIATLSDDGSRLSVEGQSNNTNLVISNDGGHSMVMGCTETTITVTAGSPASYNLTFDYFQGPPTTIGLIILYRPVPADGGLDPMCAQITSGTSVTQTSLFKTEDGDNYFFQDSPTAPTVAQAPYNQLVGPLSPSTCDVEPCQDTGGWQPVEAANYNLPAGVTNPCPNN